VNQEIEITLTTRSATITAVGTVAIIGAVVVVFALLAAVLTLAADDLAPPRGGASVAHAGRPSILPGIGSAPSQVTLR
jgi:hypothetical protein